MIIKILPSAERDLEEIYDYLFTEDPDYAEEFLNKFYASLKKLERFPRSGKRSGIFHLNRSGYRYINMGKYYIYYKIENSILYIFRLIHTSRDQNKTIN